MKKTIEFRDFLFAAGSVACLLLLIMIFSSCGDNVKGPVPEITTSEPSEVSANSVLAGGVITEDAGIRVLEAGVCWGTHKDITVADHKVQLSVADSLTGTVYGLLPEREYYVRAYATNENGIGYGKAISFTTKEGIMDVDGNAYNIVKIGSQIWMGDNLKTTKYNDGTEIPWVTNKNKWAALTTPAYTWYENDSLHYKHPYGALYNWFTVNTGVLCPAGWHVPSDEEWEILSNYLGGWRAAGAKLKETGTEHWQDPNTGATNKTGFTGVPGGQRGEGGEYFSFMGRFGRIWSTSDVEGHPNSAWLRELRYDMPALQRWGTGKKSGFSVRCIKD